MAWAVNFQSMKDHSAGLKTMNKEEGTELVMPDEIMGQETRDFHTTCVLSDDFDDSDGRRKLAIAIRMPSRTSRSAFVVSIGALIKLCIFIYPSSRS